MAKDEKERSGASTFYPRNFTISLQERLRALANGPPPFALRRRRIEDLEASIGRALVAIEDRTGEPIRPGALPATLRRQIEQLNRLIDDHNRYYPIEANLPIDVHTRQFVDWGEPWAPTPPATAEALLAAARRAGER